MNLLFNLSCDANEAITNSIEKNDQQIKKGRPTEERKMKAGRPTQPNTEELIQEWLARIERHV